MYLLRRPTIYGNDPAFFRCSSIRGITGISFTIFFLPSDLSSLSVVLTYQKEHPSDPDSYFNRRRTELAPFWNNIWNNRFLRSAPQGNQRYKTEIQLCFMLNSVFVGNIHMPGSKGNDNFGKFCQPRLYPPVRISPAWQKSS